MEKSKQEKELEDVCSAEFLESLKRLGEHNSGRQTPKKKLKNLRCVCSTTL